MVTTYGNAHTATFSLKASQSTIRLILERNSNRTVWQDDGSYIISDPNFIMRIPASSYYLQIFVDFIRMLEKPDFSNKDASTILDILHNELRNIYLFQREPVLTRIDLRYDIVLPPEECELYLLLFEKTSLSHKKLIKQGVLQYKEESVYFKSDALHESCRINIYDKQLERAKKGKTLEEHEKGVLRFEIQLMNRHLNYKRSREKIDKSLEHYLSSQTRAQYINSYILPILFSGAYRSMRCACSIIDAKVDKEHSNKSLKLLLERVSESDIDTTRKQYAPTTWNKYVQMLENLDINPITIPAKFKLDYLKNPLSFDSRNPLFKVSELEKREEKSK